MRLKIFIQVFSLSLVTIILSTTVLPQGCEDLSFTDKNRKWSVNLNGGITSFFGDLSYFDLDGWNKITAESGPAGGLVLTHYVNNWLGISGQIFAGNISGGNNVNYTFTTTLVEYNLNASINFSKLVKQYPYSKFGISGYLGIGNLLFYYKQFEYTNDNSSTIKTSSRVPEFVFFFGGKANYKVWENLALTADLSIHQLQNDKLDNLSRSGDFDYFSYFNAGIEYYFNVRLNKPFKNTARKIPNRRKVN
jgi:hypothetical protein